MIKRIGILCAVVLLAVECPAFTVSNPQASVNRPVTPSGNIVRPQTTAVLTQQRTSSVVGRPTSGAIVTQPTTTSIVTHANSTAVVNQPMTPSVVGMRPVTSVNVNRPGSVGNVRLLGTSTPGKISSAQTTMSDYKPTQPKALGGAANNAATAAKLGGGEAGLGAAQNKDAEASTSDLKQFSQQQTLLNSAAKAEERVGVLNSFINEKKNDVLRKENKNK